MREYNRYFTKSQNKYSRWYFSIIENAIKANRIKSKEHYYENHHILPKAVFPDFENLTLYSWNGALLSAKEHFIVHLLLTKIYPESNKLRFAFWAMCNQLEGDVKRDYKINSKIYEKAKREFQQANSNLHKNKKQSRAHIERSRLTFKENNPHKPGKDSHLYGKHRTNEIKSKISNTKLNYPEKNGQFNGYYVTPKGIFASPTCAEKVLQISAQVIYKRCKNPDMLINKHHIKYNVDLNVNNLNQTFGDLGFGFAPHQDVITECSDAGTEAMIGSLIPNWPA